jgi:hypothetical protein
MVIKKTILALSEENIVHRWFFLLESSRRKPNKNRFLLV